ncbi:winged helix DNA-binding domain-containing protein [Frankia sp. Mgl5]|uniref:winged helix DNA-binding domain-containing protein n=1 Tax=Frankia sp. Mgl5 TaxID=2933793 RepID=UPI00200BE0DC|nr:winged helix DNA-binding domain-containing protein [Frankia sp. Mgl5]MCK9932180.1 winged helix DNA-binding domain-containing protein [Frankia sp. Mgl5]
MAGRSASPGDVTPAVAAARLTAQGLAGTARSTAVDVVAHLLAVQAQDPRGMRLTIRSRAAGSHAADVDEALTTDRSLVVTWLNRGTLHLVRAEDYWWLHPLTAPRMQAQIRRRFTEEGVSPAQAERGVSVVERALAADGPLGRDALRERLRGAGVPVDGQALIYILIEASVRGLVVRGPVAGGEQAYVLVRDWLGPPPEPRERDDTLAELARRYLAGHGPATDRDLARWVGLPLGDARRGLAAIAADLADRDDGRAQLRCPPGLGPAAPAAGPAGAGAAAVAGVAGGDGATDVAGAGRMPPPRLLGQFDPVLLGWESRDWIVGPHRGIVTSNGIFRPFALVDGRAAGTWAVRAGRVELTAFAPLSPAVTQALRSEAADVERFLRPAGQQASVSSRRP